MTESTNESTFDYNRILTRSDGSGIFSIHFSDEEMADSFRSKAVSLQTEPDNDGSTMTPTGSDDAKRVSEDVGPVVRANDTMSHIGSVGMESISLTNFEISKSINRLADEVFREGFPILQPVVDDPNDIEREHAQMLVRDVNTAQQSLHGLLKTVVQDHARLGTGLIVVRKDYTALDGALTSSTEELVRGDPKRIRPVTDEDNRLGGLYACPLHRDTLHQSEQTCQCGVECREVTYARTEGIRDDTVQDVFFDDEIISFSFYNTRLHGRDGLSPVANIWKQAHILEQMRNYAGKFFDDETGNRYPDKLLFVTTSNADAFEKQAKQAKDNRQESPYEEGILFFENTELDVQVVDMMSSELMGQAPDIRDQYKSDIRNAFGLTDLVDGDNEQGGLARGSKQMDVMSRSIQALRTDLEREVLPEIENALELNDWELTFEEEQSEEETTSISEQAEAIQRLSDADQEYRIENGEIVLVDTDEESVTEETDGSNEDGESDSSPDVSV